MNILLWVLQVLAAFLYGASGIMKVFMFEKISHDVPSFGAMPREAWLALGILELVCGAGLIVPAALHRRSRDIPRDDTHRPERRARSRDDFRGVGAIRSQPDRLTLDPNGVKVAAIQDLLCVGLRTRQAE